MASRSFCRSRFKLLGDGLTDHHRAEALQVRHAFEIEDALDQLVGILHLADRLVAVVLAEAFVAPVVAHLGVDEVLVDGRELGGENLVEQLDDRLVAAHGRTSSAPVPTCGRAQATATAAGAGAMCSRTRLFELAVATTAVDAGPAPFADRCRDPRHPTAPRRSRSCRSRLRSGRRSTRAPGGLQIGMTREGEATLTCRNRQDRVSRRPDGRGAPRHSASHIAGGGRTEQLATFGAVHAAEAVDRCERSGTVEVLPERVVG